MKKTKNGTCALLAQEYTRPVLKLLNFQTRVKHIDPKPGCIAGGKMRVLYSGFEMNLSFNLPARRYY